MARVKVGRTMNMNKSSFNSRVKRGRRFVLRSLAVRMESLLCSRVCFRRFARGLSSRQSTGVYVAELRVISSSIIVAKIERVPRRDKHDAKKR